MIAFTIIFAIGICFGIQVGLLLSVLFEKWSTSAAQWITHKYFGSEKGD